MELKDLLLVSIPVFTTALGYWHLNADKNQVAATMEILRGMIAKMPEEARAEFEKALKKAGID